MEYEKYNNLNILIVQNEFESINKRMKMIHNQQSSNQNLQKKQIQKRISTKETYWTSKYGR